MFLIVLLLQRELKKLPVITDYNNKKIENLRYDDVDVNHHINNAVYVALAEDALFDIVGNCQVREISIDFKKSAVISDKVVSVKSFVNGNIADFSISKDDDSADFARVNIVF